LGGENRNLENAINLENSQNPKINSLNLTTLAQAHSN
jgi:hypothetical protein